MFYQSTKCARLAIPSARLLKDGKLSANSAWQILFIVVLYSLLRHDLPLIAA